MSTKIFNYIILCCTLVLLLTSCRDNGANISSTDLSVISIDGMSIYSDIDRFDLTKYTESDRYSGDYAYKFDELVIDTDRKNIVYLFTEFNDECVRITINGKTARNTAEIRAILGESFLDSVYDAEQKLKALIYYDHKNHIKAAFVYSTSEADENNLVFINLTLDKTV